MNNTTISDPTSGDDGFLGSEKTGGFGYTVGISAGIVLLIAIITLTSYVCTRNQTTTTTTRPLRTANRNEHSCVVEIGLDEKTLLSYPKLLYTEAKVNYKDSTANCCSICLADYKSKDMLRLLPDCGHLFHLKCVDPWLLLNSSCPVCRNSPLPTPLSTPLAEVAPLATRPSG